MWSLPVLTIALMFHVAISSAQTITETFGTGADAFSIDFVEVGNAGNAADTGTYFPSGTSYSAGSVSYNYNLGKYEITRDIIEKANSLGGLGIILQDMTNYGANGPNHPATGVSWNEAARFVNWLNTSNGFQAAYKFATSVPNSNISLWGAGQYIGNNQFRHKDARYFLPSVDEWYKAAYGSPNGTWYDYSIGSDSLPMAVSGGTDSGTAVYGTQIGPTEVAISGGLSAFGTMGQGGNVWEWIESASDGSNDSESEVRVIRGGRWNSSSNILKASWESSSDPLTKNVGIGGFRVAMVPEPSALSLLAVGLGGLAILRRRRS